MPLRLPPLSSLRLFEAAGRHRSFKLAAAELHVTPSAVSHGIIGLEEVLGVELFRRGPKGLLLTAGGAEYLAYVSEALSLIAIGTERLAGPRGKREIAVSCAPTLALRWLLPRLTGFTASWPDISIMIDTSRQHVGFPVDGFDFALRMSRTPAAGAGWVRLFGERLVPVCSPEYRDRVVCDGRIELGKAALLHVTLASEDWRAWLERQDIKDIALTGGFRFDSIELAFEAAVQGLGVVLGRRPLVGRELESGALVELGWEQVEAETGYWLVSSEGVEGRAELAGFGRWILEEAGVREAC